MNLKKISDSNLAAQQATQVRPAETMWERAIASPRFGEMQAEAEAAVIIARQREIGREDNRMLA